MSRKAYLYLFFISCVVVGSAVKASNHGATMEEIFGAPPATTASGAQTVTPNHPIVQAALDNLPKGGLEKAALPCRTILLGIAGGPKAIETVQAKIEGLDAKDLADLVSVTARNANILKACVKKLEDLGEERSLEAVAEWLPDYLSNMKRQLTSYKKLALFTRNAHKTKVANNNNAEVVQGSSSPQEPRLWQMNYLMVRKLMQRVQSYELAPPNDWDDLAGGGELKKFFIEDASLHLDFLLLQRNVLERIKPDENCPASANCAPIAKELLHKLNLNLKKVREECKAWGIPDAESRQTPYNFKNETVTFEEYTIALKDGVVHTALYRGQPLEPVAEATMEEAKTQKKKRPKQHIQAPETEVVEARILKAVIDSLPQGGLEKANLRSRMVFLGCGKKDEEIEAFCAQAANSTYQLDIYRLAAHNLKIQQAYHNELNGLLESAKQSELAVLTSIRRAIRSSAVQLPLHKKVVELLQQKLAAKNVDLQNLGDCVTEPRIWQMDSPVFSQMVQNGMTYRTKGYAPACPEVMSLFIKEVSLHLDLMILHHTALESIHAAEKAVRQVQGAGGVPGQEALQSQSILRGTKRSDCKMLLENVRKVCADYKISDAMTRQIPHNFKNVVITFGMYAVVFEDGKPKEVRNGSRVIDKIAAVERPVEATPPLSPFVEATQPMAPIESGSQHDATPPMTPVEMPQPSDVTAPLIPFVEVTQPMAPIESGSQLVENDLLSLATFVTESAQIPFPEETPPPAIKKRKLTGPESKKVKKTKGRDVSKRKENEQASIPTDPSQTMVRRTRGTAKDIDLAGHILLQMDQKGRGEASRTK